MVITPDLTCPAILDRACEDCPRTRTLAVEHVGDRRLVTVLAGCGACEGSHFPL